MDSSLVGSLPSVTDASCSLLGSLPSATDDSCGFVALSFRITLAGLAVALAAAWGSVSCSVGTLPAVTDASSGFVASSFRVTLAALPSDDFLGEWVSG